MKKSIIAMVFILGSLHLLAQVPEGINHQAIIRDAQGKLVTNKTIGIRVSILQGAADGTAAYVELHAPESNANGLVTFVVGKGTILNGVFGEIDWASGSYFLKTEVDPEGGSNYSIEGTTQFLSVPYAMHAVSAETALQAKTLSDGAIAGEILYWNGHEWVAIAPGEEGDMMRLCDGIPTWGDCEQAPVWPRDTQTQVVDVLNPATGKIWMDRNLGASRAATSSTDADAYGDLYQWGRAADGHEKRTSGTTSTLSDSDTPGHGNFITSIFEANYDWRSPQNDNLWQGVNGVNNPCPPGYRVPTEAELDPERQSWSSNDSAGAFASQLKLPVAGRRSYSDGLVSEDSYGLYWLSTTYASYSLYLDFGNSNADVFYYGSRARGYSVRCLKDN